MQETKSGENRGKFQWWGKIFYDQHKNKPQMICACSEFFPNCPLIEKQASQKFGALALSHTLQKKSRKFMILK